MKIYSKDRSKAVKIFDDMSELEGLKEASQFCFNAKREEYYVVQLLMTQAEGCYNIAVEGLRDIAMVYNTEGTNKFGEPFNQEFVAEKGKINPIYIGFDFSGFAAGEYSCKVIFDGAEKQIVTLNFNIGEAIAENHGYNDLTTLARLNWLNSKRALDDELVAPFTPIESSNDNCARILGRKLEFDNGLSLNNVISYFDEGVNLTDKVQAKLLASKIDFCVAGESFAFDEIKKDVKKSVAIYCVKGNSSNFETDVKAVLKAEGHLEYFVTLTAKKDCKASVSLNIPFDNAAAQYNMGLGKKGGAYKDIECKWGDMRYDSMFVGTVNVGAMVRLKAEDYRNPLVNIYYANLPIIKPERTWDNFGKGTISIKKDEKSATFTAATGDMQWEKGETRVFRYELFLTPFKFIDYKKHYKIRYYHSNNLKGKEYKHLDIAKSKGLNYFNVHHGNELHPYINYPFIETERMKKFVQEAKKSDIGVKLYYTTREMSNHTAEVFCFKALGSEIIMQKKGQGLTMFNKREWLDKYFGENVIQAWQVHYKSGAHKGDHDIAFIIQPDSRLDNYYIEGLQWLVDNIGIKGIYIDDTSLDATTIRRAKKVLEKTDGLIDMHMWNHEEARAGDAACMNIYTDILPFLDSLWIGEGFDCRSLPADYIFTEVAGIMYGNTSQMLQDGGDPYAGMLYAMNNRYGWGVYNADKIYKVWDDFGIENSYMFGYWHSGNPIKTDNENVKVTAYVKDKKALIATYNFAASKQSWRYSLCEDKLGFKPKQVNMIYLTAGENLVKKQIDLEKTNSLKGRKGVLFEIIG